MKVLILSGSRNRKGRTAQLIKALEKGLSRADGQFETIFLTECKLERCRQCNADGWGVCLKERRCILQDDFVALVDKIRSSAAVVFASPVYYQDLSESLRCFLDRLRRTGLVTQPADGKPAEALKIPAVGLCFAGGSGNGTTEALANLERILRSCGFDCVDMITARRQNLEMKLPLLEKVGEWLISRPSSGPLRLPQR
jgi:multimeric flavodoxin WrbA